LRVQDAKLGLKLESRKAAIETYAIVSMRSGGFLWDAEKKPGLTRKARRKS
jgi:hypothetical protein